MHNPIRSFVLLAATLALVVACASGPEPGSAGPTDTLARIDVRQQIMQRAAPDVPIVQEQTRATRADVKEARSGIEQMEAQLKQAREQLAAAKSDQAKALAMVQVQHQRWMSRMRVLCIAAIPIGLGLAFSVSKRWAILPVGAVVCLIAIAVDGFTWKYAIPIAGGVLGALAIIALVCVVVYLRANKELVKSGDLLINLFGRTAAGEIPARLASQLDDIQSATTKRIVDLHHAKARTAAAQA